MSLVFINVLEKLRFPLLSFIALTLFSIFLYKWLTSTKNLVMPPSPPRLPIIGHLHLLGRLTHRSLTSLSHKYGNLMLLYFGNRPTLVVSSASAAEAILKTHDVIFANRPQLRFIHKIFYDGNDVAFGWYSEKWRRWKSICVLQLLSNKRVQSLRYTREEEIGQVIEEIKSYKGSVINLSEMFFMFSKGLICRTTLGKKYAGNGKISNDFYNLFKELSEVMLEVSFGDYIPYLGWVDKLTGLEGRAETVRKHFNDFIEEVIQEHEARLNENQVDILANDDKGQRVKDFVDVLLEIQRENPEQLSRENVKAIIMDTFVAGTETTSTTLEWAMTELLRHPKIMKQLQEEVRFVVKDNTRVTEDDLENMKCLKAVIKETLRLHPPIPLVFRESSQHVQIEKYDISARTQVLINAWAIQRDPNFWHDPENFNPMRFLENSSSVDYRGHHLQYIPFGAGRRSCPGMTYSFISVERVLASFLYEFDWTLPKTRIGETLEIEERRGTTVGRQKPLMVIATPTLPFL